MALFHSQTRRHMINSGYLLFSGEYQIYLIECGEKNQYFSRVRSTSENADIFTTRDEIYFVFAVKKNKFSFYFILNRNTEITTLLFTWSFLVRFDFCSVFIGYNIGCKHSLHLENHILTNRTQEISI